MPTRATRNKQECFLEAIRRGATVAAAAEHAHVDRTLPYAWETNNPAFAQAWTTARETRLAQLKDTAFDLALDGSESMIRYLLNRYEHVEDKTEKVSHIEIIIPGDDADAAHDFITLT
jgi:transposase-like protein